MLHEQASPSVTTVPPFSVARHFPTSVLLQEQRDDFKPLMNMFKEEKASQVRHSLYVHAYLFLENN